MRISLSFVLSPMRFVPALAVGVAALALTLFVIAVVIAVDARGLHNDIPQLKTRLEKMRAELATTAVENPGELPPRAELIGLRQQVARINALTGKTGQPLLSLLARIEPLLPDNARLVSLHYVRETGISTLVVESASDELLTQFLQRLEQSGQFAEVLLTRQSQQSQRTDRMRQYALRLKEHV